MFFLFRCEARIKDDPKMLYNSTTGHLQIVHHNFSEEFTSEYEHRAYLPPSPPVLLFNTENEIEVLEGAVVTLECLSNDHSSPQPIIWSKKGIYISPFLFLLFA